MKRERIVSVTLGVAAMLLGAPGSGCNTCECPPSGGGDCDDDDDDATPEMSEIAGSIVLGAGITEPTEDFVAFVFAVAAEDFEQTGTPDLSNATDIQEVAGSQFPLDYAVDVPLDDEYYLLTIVDFDGSGWENAGPGDYVGAHGGEEPEPVEPPEADAEITIWFESPPV